MQKNRHPEDNHATYFVAMKILAKHDGKYLFLTDASGARFDLPGGRIDESEKNIPIEKILAREVKEELGKDFKYKLGKPLFQYRRIFNNNNTKVFITVYDAEYLKGRIKLSSEHTRYQWLDPKKLKFSQKDFIHKEEYLAFRKYFLKK